MITLKLKPVNKIKIHNVKTLEEILRSIQVEARLNDDDIAILIFTSIDQDWFTNMIILQAEFMKWFTINFDDDDGAVEDF